MLAIALILFAAIFGLNGAHEWSYNAESQWGGVCTTGYQQSPINIISSSAIVDKYDTHIRSPLVFQGYESVNASAANDGHALKWTIKDASKPMVSGGPLRGSYNLVHFHMHWLSEHTIDGMMYPMEIHLVHIKPGLTEAEALEHPDGIVVIVMFAEMSDTKDNEYALGELELIIPYLQERNGKSVPASVIDITRIFSPNVQSYYTYDGSLTTPTCDEVVTWIVMDRPIRISDTQFKLVTAADIGGITNHRTLQPVNDRVIYRSKESSEYIALPSVLGVIGALLNLPSSVSVVMIRGVCTLVNMKREFFGDDIEECSIPAAFVN